jgi:hypothetical protein
MKYWIKLVGLAWSTSPKIWKAKLSSPTAYDYKIFAIRKQVIQTLHKMCQS